MDSVFKELLNVGGKGQNPFIFWVFCKCGNYQDMDDFHARGCNLWWFNCNCYINQDPKESVTKVHCPGCGYAETPKVFLDIGKVETKCVSCSTVF